MLGNMLNDLAEAIRRWTEKKGTFVAFDKVTALHVNYNSTVCRD